LSLGLSDKLADAIWYLYNELHIDREESEEKIVEFICNSTDKRLLKMVNDFTNLVPYRLLRPFYQREIDYERKCDVAFNDGKVNAIIEKHNKNDQNNALYRMDRLNKTLTVSGKWAEYIRINASVIEGWLNFKLIKYIQERNPNIPAIPFKLFPPSTSDRNLSKETKFWLRIQNQIPLYDIYTGKEFTDENYKVYGGFSIDHFIPWSFVLHNEIWNLYPMFKNVNSEKNNKLPDKDRYINRFCEYQYRAFMVAKKMPQVRKTVEQYLTVRKDIFSIEEGDRGHSAFTASLKQTIEPLYQIANNQGYGIWWYG